MYIHDIVAFDPQITQKKYGKEPCLYELIIKYYEQYMSANEAIDCANSYVRALQAEFETKDKQK